MKPKVYTSIDLNEARSPLVRVVHADEWDLLMNELRYLRGERAAAVAWLREMAHIHQTRGCSNIGNAVEAYAEDIANGWHRRKEEP